MHCTLLVTTATKTGNWDGNIVTQNSHCTKAFFFYFQTAKRFHGAQNTAHSLLNAGLHVSNAQQQLCPDHLNQTLTKLGNKCGEGG
jgi:hypothetical protein